MTSTFKQLTLGCSIFRCWCEYPEIGMKSIWSKVDPRGISGGLLKLGYVLLQLSLLKLRDQLEGFVLLLNCSKLGLGPLTAAAMGDAAACVELELVGFAVGDVGVTDEAGLVGCGKPLPQLLILSLCGLYTIRKFAKLSCYFLLNYISWQITGIGRVALTSLYNSIRRLSMLLDDRLATWENLSLTIASILTHAVFTNLLFELAQRGGGSLEPGRVAFQWDLLKVLEEFGHLTPSQVQRIVVDVWNLAELRRLRMTEDAAIRSRYCALPGDLQPALATRSCSAGATFGLAAPFFRWQPAAAKCTGVMAE
ncbi:hypothetical protein AK812_SmicGene16508 [Symbiodinium microadriaticum]|uniref:Uncharacterized protein n=1 Tax=Symbiodinium microadriaticum TaxID=2951 RepID=A0A1Q9E052_SYMMI|nr:hypothetical protein AK812_SmicGene16508 [Symbiodinium microadriaticum]